MRKTSIFGASALALCAALATGHAGAAGAPRIVTASPADYNAAQVATAGGILTVPAGLATYQVNRGSLEVNSRFTVTLPPNFSFGSQLALAAGGGTSTFTLATGGIGSQSTSFVVSGAPLAPGGTVSLGSFSVQGATALERAIPVAAALPVSLQSTNNSQIDNNDPSPITVGAFASEPGLFAVFDGDDTPALLVDLTSPSLGTEFAGTASPLEGNLGFLSYGPQALDATRSVPVLSPNGLQNTLSTADTMTVTIEGLFNGIKTAYASGSPTCPSIDFPGSATGTQITIPNIPVGAPDGGQAFLCVEADGTTLISEDLQGLQPIVTPGASADFLGADLNIGALGYISYTGGGVLSVSNFFTGDDSGYSSLLRVSNGSTAPVTLYALVQPDTGGAPLTGPLGKLPAQSGTVFTEPQLAAAVPGLNLANSGQRATLRLIIGGDAVNVAASGLLVNPSGVITNVDVTPPQNSR
jgi:hypothetical protein